jgi:hypothetical protein
MLGDSSTAFTADLYTSVFTNLMRQADEAIALAVSRAARTVDTRKAA